MLQQYEQSLEQKPQVPAQDIKVENTPEVLPQAGQKDQYGREVTGSGQGYYSYSSPEGAGLYVNKEILPNIGSKVGEFLKEGFVPLYSAKKRGMIKE